jgi:hypothetical protein
VETGNEEVFIQDADGKNREQLTHMNRPRMGRVRWSPDGKLLIFDAAGGDNGGELFVMAAMPGAQPGRVAIQAGEGTFSMDGKSIYYQQRAQIFKAALNGSNAHLLVKRMGAFQPVESADGKYVLFRFRRGIARIPVNGDDPDPEEFIVPDQEMLWGAIQPAKKGVYFAVWERSRRGTGLCFYDYESKKSTVVAHVEGFDRGGSIFSVSPDGKWVIYPKTDRSQTNLMLVENFK